jgi:hypothetical protein
MRYTIKLNRGYWEARDSKGRLVSLAFQLGRLRAKFRLWREIAITDNNNKQKEDADDIKEEIKE